MPIYEYRCANCAHELEIMQKMADEPLTKCPECGQNSLNKLISRSSFRLKGGGWYESGYTKSDNKSEGNKEKSAGASADNTSASSASNPKTENTSATTSTSASTTTPASTISHSSNATTSSKKTGD